MRTRPIPVIKHCVLGGVDGKVAVLLLLAKRVCVRMSGFGCFRVVLAEVDSLIKC